MLSFSLYLQLFPIPERAPYWTLLPTIIVSGGGGVTPSCLPEERNHEKLSCPFGGAGSPALLSMTFSVSRKAGLFFSRYGGRVGKTWLRVLQVEKWKMQGEQNPLSSIYVFASLFVTRIRRVLAVKSPHRIDLSNNGRNLLPCDGDGKGVKENETDDCNQLLRRQSGFHLSFFLYLSLSRTQVYTNTHTHARVHLPLSKRAPERDNVNATAYHFSNSKP